ncbi:substrate-binding domain-containing protein [Teredinibacter purpureus]|uniref:substrate-binding domain-containing protein n=1 Tax=Teredinibacter purpureus TaxID=2731756 RepID=UPI0005F764E9|nr:substrate-binding domain-containing protein [Teredinibacter purpureus]
MFRREKKPLHIGVITPYLQGDYMGEIIEHIRHNCELKHYRFSAIRTNGFGHYTLGIGLNSYSAIIVLRNAANPKLIEKIQNRGIPIIAIAHDYFPLDVPVLTCDNNLGAEQAFDYLQCKNHTDMLFIGDITQYDLRKRYERFCELLKEHQLPCGSAQLICAPNTVFSGGLTAGIEFLQQNSRCTGILCGAGYTAIGFIKKLEEFGFTFPGPIDVVAFDAIRMTNLLTPHLTYIDQNLDLLAKRSLTLLESIIHSSVTPPKTITISPSLYGNSVEPNNDSSANAPNMHGRQHLHKFLDNTDYTGALLNNSFEITRDIVNSRLDNLMDIAPLFSQFLNFGVLSCITHDRKYRIHLSTHKIFERGQTLCIPGNGSDETYTCLPESFPPPAIRAAYALDGDTWVHFPIFCEDDLWGVLSLSGSRETAHHPSSFSSFTAFIDTITFSYSLLLENTELRQQLKQSIAKAPKVNRNSSSLHSLPSFEWDLEKGSVMWSDLALEMLGFTTELEKNIYRNMEIFDRVHPEDETRLRKELTTSLSNLGTMSAAVRLKNTDGEYHNYTLQGEILHREESRAISYRCCLSVIN